MNRQQRTAWKRDIRRRKACSKHHPPREKDSMPDTNEVESPEPTVEHVIQSRWEYDQQAGGGWSEWTTTYRYHTQEERDEMWQWIQRQHSGVAARMWRKARVTTWTEVETEVLG